jgi:hypothetical protein
MHSPTGRFHGILETEFFGRLICHHPDSEMLHEVADAFALDSTNDRMRQSL